MVSKIRAYIIDHKSDFEGDEFDYVSFVDVEDIAVSGVTFEDAGNDELIIRTSIDTIVEVKGKRGRDYETDGVTKCYNIFFKGVLSNGFRHVTISEAEEYNPRKYDGKKSLSQSLLHYIREEEIEDYAEQFLSRNYKKALLQPMRIDAVELAKSMGMEVYYAPLKDSIFGMTYFGEEKVTVFKDFFSAETEEIQTKPGTMLINPNVYFMRNVGTVNNTIVHECVHWDMHRRAFELQSLLEGDCNHISCEIVEEYNGIAKDDSALRWMEWQANQLAPRILMPQKWTKKVYSDSLRDYHLANPEIRYAEVVQFAVDRVREFFGVSLFAAKLRLIELGFDEVMGAYVYCDGKYLPPFYFRKRNIDSNKSFVIDEQNFIVNVTINDKLRELFINNVVVYANCMLCLNDSKYVTKNINDEYILTDYALENVDECCFLFDFDYSISKEYSDTFYRRCFLCREVDADTFIPAQYDAEHEINQEKEEMQEEIDKIIALAQENAKAMKNKIPSGFAGTLDYHMTTQKITAEELQDRCGVSTVSISGYRNDTEVSIEKGTVLALCKGLYLQSDLAEDMLSKAGFALTPSIASHTFIKHLIYYHMDDTWEQWVTKLEMAKICKDWIPARNPIVKSMRAEREL